ncbi:hypothetical protein N7519_003472 [Penicillium mononematosum]|uniref:uncharacterized protein n=1 Tax=Penicillium mononematosum TaxID=268346 RepID=UPI002546CF98|nr:uncharacterized protein N7519_003472 [Penicillium mononematosum]KAJ6188564.1 hypothetical protein N7519_003472 [Penicillium mononematosum]
MRRMTTPNAGASAAGQVAISNGQFAIGNGRLIGPAGTQRPLECAVLRPNTHSKERMGMPTLKCSGSDD